MLVPDQMVEVKVGGKTIKHYKSLGYEVKNRQKIIIPINHLPLTSHEKVKVQCDICKNIIDREYRNYFSKHVDGYDYCNKCKTKKIEQTCLEKYGVSNVMYIQENKDKIKATNLERYGTENVSGLPKFQEKYKNTCVERFGVSNPMQNEEIQEKLKQTMISNYGVLSPLAYKPFREVGKITSLTKYGYEFPTQSNLVQNKIRQTNLNKYGVEYVFQSEEVKDKIKNTLLINYGVTHNSQIEQIKEKARKTCIKKYGVSSPLASSMIREKGKQTCIEKYGVDSPMKLAYFREKANRTLVDNGMCKTSSQQLELHKMIQEQYPDAILNYPCGVSIFDIAIFINDDIKIDIEYDCWYWHKNKDRDKRRDYYHIRRGWKVLRVKSGMKLPPTEELFEAIDYLINTKHHHKNIILDDWKEPNKEASA